MLLYPRHRPVSANTAARWLPVEGVQEPVEPLSTFSCDIGPCSIPQAQESV